MRQAGSSHLAGGENWAKASKKLPQLTTMYYSKAP
jgi:hypothetical protein